MRFWLKIALVGFAVAVLLLFLAAAIVALWPRAAAETLASRLLQRPVTLAALQIRWGDPLRVTLEGLALGNAPGLEASHMLTIAHLDAEIDARALLDGRVVYRRLRVDRPVVVLERDAKGHGNWKFGGDASASSSSGGLALIPKSRAQFPSLLDMTALQGMVRYRASSGGWISIPLDDLRIQAQDEDAPVTLTLDGGYNDTDAQLSAATASFNALRDASKPFDASFNIVTPAARIDFKGVMTEPLDFEGVQGRLALDAPQMDALLGIFKSAVGLDRVPLRMTGALTRNGDQWHYDGLNGDLAGNAFEGSLALQEGPRGRSDQIRVVLDFARLDLTSLLPATDKAAKQPGWRGMKLQPPAAPDTAQLDLQLSAQRFAYAPWQAEDLTMAMLLAPGTIRIERLAAKLAGGDLELRGAMTAVATEKESGRLAMSLSLDHANADRLLTMLGLPDGQLAGALDLRGTLTMQGATLGQALRTAQGQTVIAMQEGRIARGLVELASADLRTLFRQKDEAARLLCLLAVGEVKDGRGRLVPLTLRSIGGTLRGAGGFSLIDPQIDLLIQSDPKTTGAFALDIPIRLHGPLNGEELNATPLRTARLPELPVPALQGEAAKLAQGNPCWK